MKEFTTDVFTEGCFNDIDIWKENILHGFKNITG